MPLESIGSVDTGQMPEEEDWIVFALEIARMYLLHVEPPPPGHSLEIAWSDHDLCAYPTLAVSCTITPDADYVGRCERALELFDASVDWQAIKPSWEADQGEVDCDEDG